MLFPSRFWPGLADGTVTLAFRRWKRPTVKASGTLQTAAGQLRIHEVVRIGTEGITDEDARAAGYPDRQQLLADLRPEGDLYRIRFSRIGDDPRLELRQRAALDESELDDLRHRLARLPWAGPTLRIIAAHPSTVSTELAARLGVERAQLKQRVRRLKALGLTESLETGYRLSPRGHAALHRLDADL